VINLPLIFRGNFIGTVNMLHEAGYYTEERVERAKQLAIPALPGVRSVSGSHCAGKPGPVKP
jgi:hypothetical protein